MANYVYSTLYINGTNEDIKKFREKFEVNGKLEASNVILYPREFELLDKKNNKEKLTENDLKELTLIGLEGKYDTNKDGYNQGGYDWCIVNWGTKWGFCDCLVTEEDKGFVNYDFSTAWSPISPVILEMAKQFPNLEFDYYCDEESGDFRIEEYYKNGKLDNAIDKTYEIEIERQQEEDDYNLERERDRKIEEKMEKTNG